MSVRLIAITHPVVDECPVVEDLLAYCARVSNPTNQANTQTSGRLLAYLIRHQHWSPFEMASMTLEITTTRDIARQILRHRSFSFQEFSQRYAAVSAPAVLRDARLQDQANRQSSLLVEHDADLAEWWRVRQAELADHAQRTYREALELGLAKEVARAVLPEGLTESRLYMAGTIRSWIHYVQLRTEAGTQREHQAIAAQCRAILFQEFPDLRDAMEASHAA